ncbi:hypothetical protein YC2023_095056 [Brassica napus]
MSQNLCPLGIDLEDIPIVTNPSCRVLFNPTISIFIFFIPSFHYNPLSLFPAFQYSIISQSLCNLNSTNAIIIKLQILRYQKQEWALWSSGSGRAWDKHIPGSILLLRKLCHIVLLNMVAETMSYCSAHHGCGYVRMKTLERVCRGLHLPPGG